ncbi:50S ribosomal protein L9 [Candidatus Campbellbacteria bacterium CG10_big_fil_rev_8_21_14_0_10_35_52]|uniref:Large ribosomal subunit protein bL9 n=1 Tax=Candidatus Campbellbacteria bacterium CG10_big_fil_rev_8_21_14_0_10_35_52 TaxID=1974527 RepID=A0A2M6WVD7_9BACT|nr:MAG: 50S ribosomal protein L9 [Candidatus Campbellbacteria bacterium CG10_big_fil_rev_8_21_14_0_10_35_52]
MKIILLKDIPKVGNKFDVKNISDGYALNFLIPNKLAEFATPKKIKEIETMKLRHKEEDILQQDLFIKNMKALNNAKIYIEEKANEKGHLFKGIHKEEIATELKKQGHIDIKSEYIQLEHMIKEAGEFDISAKASGVSAVFKLIINNKTTA